MKPLRAWMAPVAAALLMALLAGCGEKQPRAIPKGERGYNGEAGIAPLRERTLNQGAGERMQDSGL
jgi:predicted small lipoprotein YifL